MIYLIGSPWETRLVQTDVWRKQQRVYSVFWGEFYWRFIDNFRWQILQL